MKINHPTQDYTRWNLPEGAKARLGKGWINEITYSPDGRLLAVGSSIGIWLYDADTGEELNIILGHTQSVESVSFSPDSRTLVSSSGDKTVRLWDIETGKPLKTLTGHTSSVKYVSFSPNNHILASVGMYKDEIRLWDVETGKHLKTLIGHKGWLDNNVAFSPNGRLMASGNGDGTVLVWDIETGKHIKTFTGHNGVVKSISFSPDGRTLASCSSDGTVLLWNVDFLENTEFLSRKSQIKHICQDQGITTLVHFTQIKHLRSILHEGLLDHQSLLKKHGQQFVSNDKQRIDGHKEAICLSISFPNYPLFSKFSWSDNDNQPDYTGWVVLLLDAKVLWELNCAFCQENAASNAVRHIPLEERKKPDALKGMFVEVCRDTKGDVYERQSMQILNHYPTHPQAEVLVFDTIPVKYIKEVHFYNETALEQWRYSNTGDYPPKLSVNQQYFQYGRDQIVCKDDNLDDDIPPAPPPEDDNLDDVIPF